MAAYLSDTFFHFVGRRDPLDHDANYDKLAAILNSRCVRVPPDMPGSSIRRDLAQTLLSGELIKPSMTCFAEIQEEHLARTASCVFDRFTCVLHFRAESSTIDPEDSFGIEGP